LDRGKSAGAAKSSQLLWGWFAIMLPAQSMLTPAGAREITDMAENKTKPTEVRVDAFIETITDETKRADAKRLIKLMQSASGEKPEMWGPSIVGFGSFHYKYESGREGDMPLIGFSPRKAANVLYGAIGFKGADALLAKLGKHTTGKGCLYIKKLSDVDQNVLEAMLVESLAARRGKSP
jgi:Domain of unknown function (DU1801)